MNSNNVIDIHGETGDSIVAIINEFIEDNYKLRETIVYIIHGKGEGILRKKTHELLHDNILVESYKLDNWNLGITIINLKRLDK